jgi:hypothetical protein
MTTTHDGGPVHPMVMKAARGLCREVARQMEESDSELWDNERENLILAAQAAITECGALQCFNALALYVDGSSLSVDAPAMAKAAIAEARDLSSAGVVYGSAPE